MAVRSRSLSGRSACSSALTSGGSSWTVSFLGWNCHVDGHHGPYGGVGCTCLRLARRDCMSGPPFDRKGSPWPLPGVGGPPRGGVGLFLRGSTEAELSHRVGQGGALPRGSGEAEPFRGVGRGEALPRGNSKWAMGCFRRPGHSWAWSFVLAISGRAIQ